ncbi:hypothetical protein HID58_014590, partial [Brassica napus]
RKMSAMEPDEYDEDYKEKATIELTTRMDELKEEMNMNRRQNAIQSKASINGLTRLSIDGGYGYLKKWLVIVKLLEDKLDAINFSQDLMREDYSQRLENL